VPYGKSILGETSLLYYYDIISKDVSLSEKVPSLSNVDGFRREFSLHATLINSSN
jgi:hypothetical protein